MATLWLRHKSGARSFVTGALALPRGCADRFAYHARGSPGDCRQGDGFASSSLSATGRSALRGAVAQENSGVRRGRTAVRRLRSHKHGGKNEQRCSAWGHATATDSSRIRHFTVSGGARSDSGKRTLPSKQPQSTQASQKARSFRDRDSLRLRRQLAIRVRLLGLHKMGLRTSWRQPSP